MLRRCVLVALMLSLVCASVPAPARASISTGQEVQAGKASDKEVTEEIGIVDDPLMNAWVNDISHTLWTQVARKDVPYNIKILDGSDVNAFTTMGGYIYIYQGTLDFVQSDDELASVIGHETGHDERRHAVTLQNKENISSLLIGLGSMFSPFVYRFGQLAQAGYIAKVEREDELQADQYGLLLMSRAGYDPDAAVSFMQHLGAVHAEKSSIVDKYFADHPGVPDRVAHLVGYPELDPKTRTTDQIMAQALHDEGECRYSIAAMKFATVLRAQPDNTEALLHLGQMQVALGQTSKGEQSLAQAAQNATGATQRVALASMQSLRDQQHKYTLLHPSVQPLRDQIADAQRREADADAAIATRRDAGRDQVKAITLRLQGISAAVPDLSRVQARHGSRLDTIIKNFNAMARSIDTVDDKTAVVLGGVGSMEPNKEGGLVKDNNDILKDMAAAIKDDPVPAQTLSVLPSYPQVLADVGSADADIIRAVDATRGSLALMDVGLNDLTTFVNSLGTLRMDFGGDVTQGDYNTIVPAMNRAVEELSNAAVASSQAAQLYNMARSAQLQSRITLLGLGYPDTRYATLQKALAARFKSVTPPDYTTMQQSGLTAGEIASATIVAADTNTTPQAVIQEAKSTHRSIIDVANSRGMHAQALEIFLGLIYLDYVDDPAKESRGVS